LTARAVAAGVAIPMSRAEFEHLLTHDPVECRHYLKSLFERLRSVAARVDAAGQAETGALSIPSVTIYPMNLRTEDVLAKEGFKIPKFPWRIGRAPEADEPQPLDLNDMWLMDGPPFHVSRNHFALELTSYGTVAVADRGSHLGTMVNGQLIGRNTPKRQVVLKTGENFIFVGDLETPFQFRVVVEPG
jgi:pSer/pThr/pTyr-binding forkhead associated (FHA) protein